MESNCELLFLSNIHECRHFIEMGVVHCLNKMVHFGSLKRIGLVAEMSNFSEGLKWE